MTLLLYLALGACAGTMAGLFGVGGGLIIVPALIYAFGAQGLPADVTTHLAIGTSLATIVVTSLSSVRAHQLRGSVDWRLAGLMVAGIVLGSALGAHTAGLLSGPQLQLALGCFVLIMALQMGLGLQADSRRQLPGVPGLTLAGGVVGWVSALFGIGGGSLTVPFLSWCNVRMQRAVGTSAACGVPIAVVGAMGYMLEGWGRAGLPPGSTGFVYWPAFFGIVVSSTSFARVGARLAHRLPPARLKRFFALFLLVIGLRLAYGSGLIGG
jgi:uncharacterized membrane protein YfcA